MTKVNAVERTNGYYRSLIVGLQVVQSTNKGHFALFCSQRHHSLNKAWSIPSNGLKGKGQGLISIR
jgi:hypothetical protein